MAEILKRKLTEAHSLIAYEDIKATLDPGGRRPGKSERKLGFKVGPMEDGWFVECSPEAASVLLAMLDHAAE